MRSCRFCRGRVDPTSEVSLCLICEQAFFDCRLVTPLFTIHNRPLFSLWHYRGIVRNAILAFKVQSTWAAGACLVDQALSAGAPFSVIAAVDVIMPMPSSFWGRVRGRYDLAALMAAALAYKIEKPLIEAPWRIQGRWHKQAQRSRLERERDDKLPSAPRWGAQDLQQDFAGGCSQRRLRVLLVDDIVTTGQSLASFMGHFADVEFQILTLASALKEERNSSRLV